jgi:hypothetical protein
MPHQQSIFVKPAPGLIITDPGTGSFLPGDGLLVPRNGFWLRRLKDGDVIEVAQDAPKPARKAKE